MWGDPQRACSLETSDALSALLLQITGPAHIPWNDARWQELFLGYDVWVHLQHDQQNVVAPACASMVKHARTSSNLAALALHVSRMTKELLKATMEQQQEQNDQTEDGAAGTGFTRRIALVGKARATAGALCLMRVLVHDVIVMHSSSSQEEESSLQEVLMYRSRDVSDRATLRNVDAGADLLSSLLSFCSHMGDPAIVLEKNKGGGDTLLHFSSVPELYDATVLSLELLLVLLSSQLYQPMVSSAQQCEMKVGHRQEQDEEDSNYFLDLIMAEAEKRQRQQRKRQQKQQQAFLIANNNDNNNLVDESSQARPFSNNATTNKLDWSPQSVLKSCVTWLIQRPRAPDRSIAHHNAELARAVVEAKGGKVGPDGMYESHLVVMAAINNNVGNSEHGVHPSTHLVPHHGSNSTMMRPPSQLILDATKGVLVLSSTLILLPFRLMSLALGLWGYKHDHADSGYDQSRMVQLRSSAGGGRRTHDVLWLSESPIADLGSSLFLLLTNNHRAPREENNDQEGNPFRSELAALNDNRWEGSDSFGSNTEAAIPDPLGHAAQDDSNNNGADFGKPVLNESNHENQPMARLKHRSGLRQLLTTNFESLFEAFGNIVHTEVGALVLYTVLQSSPIFAASVAVRSDLDMLVLPLLRTLYFSSAIGHYAPKDFASTPRQSNDALHSPKSDCPFRSQSQLYVILILLLLFSQDASFGTDAFRRVTVSNIVWYKERNLKDINLGSVLILTLLRSITFNTNRLRDPFLLSNCCAVLMNLSPNIVNIHEYAAMRLASVTMSALKRYCVLVAKNGGKVSTEEDISTDVGMYGEVSRTLLRLLRYCVGPKNVDKNLHLVYALVYHQRDFHNIVSNKNCPFTQLEIGRIETVISEAAKVIQQDGDARTAPKALSVLKNSMGQIKEAVTQLQRSDSSSGEMPAEDAGDFTFAYEEEADPEIFFIPYIWEVIVCVVTVTSVEWDKNHIQVFPLIEADDEKDNVIPQVNGTSEAAPKGYSDDVSNVV